MHEMSVALEVCRLAEEQVGRGGLPRVTAIGLDVGVESGLVIENLTFCLEALLTSPPFVAARVVVARTPGNALRLDWLEIDDPVETPICA
jgi:Zn finger protein HypA/HybF involved in hydrogenase expression